MKIKLSLLLLIGAFITLLLAGCEDDPQNNTPDQQLPDITIQVTEQPPSQGTNDIKSVTLNWETVHAETCTLNGISVELKGSKTLEIPQDIIFIFVATGEGGTKEKKVEVKASTVPAEPIPNIVFFTAYEYTLPEGGGGTWLEWKVLNAFLDSVSISGNGNTWVVDTIGSRYTGFMANSGDTDLQVIYTLTAKGPGGTSTSQLTLVVPAIPPPPPPPTMEELLCAGPWYLVKLEFMTPPSTEWVEASIDECLLDNFLTFYINPNLVIYDFGLISCSVGEPQTSSGPWTLVGMILNMGMDETIEILTGDILIKTNYSGSSDKQVRRTYAHQPLQ